MSHLNFHILSIQLLAYFPFEVCVEKIKQIPKDIN